MKKEKYQDMENDQKPDPEKEIPLKIAFIGNWNIGAKTCFIIRYVRGVFDNSTIGTIGIVFYSKNVNVRGRNVKVDIWDTAGAEKFFALSLMYIRDAAGVVMGYDITNRDSFNAIRWRMMEVKRAHFEGKKVFFMLIGNKADLESDRQVSHEEGEELARELDIPLFFESKQTKLLCFEIFPSSFLFSFFYL